MPKKNPKPRQSKPSLITKTTTNLQKLSSLQKLIAMLCIAIAILFLWHQANIYREHNTYKQAEKQITAFIDKAAKLAPSTKEVRKYCSRSSAKFDDGFLSCAVRSNLEYKPMTEEEVGNTIARLEAIHRPSDWVFAYDNTDQNKDTPAVIKIVVYNYQALTCSVSYDYKSSDPYGEVYDPNILVVEAGCTGSALKEHYK
ncbi:hypothetical protein CSA80_03615 [Candidatus Saccharibacteria bacterium]|nr:MAG: hypothetical protein CR973_01105 [Candidatus Saccharibacteria bacterium]PID99175.1 MAG: hypothetical protein CSA80_03615 [Candidatus Saccharibacteria bacterium]